MIVSEAAGTSPGVFPFARRTKAISDYFLKAMCEIRIVVPTLSSRAVSTGEAENVEFLKTYETNRRDLGSPIAALFMPLDVERYVASFRRFNPDVILVAGISPFLLIETLVAAKLRRVAVVFDVRDSWLLMRAVHRGRLRNTIRVLMEGFALRQGDVVIGVTKTLLALMTKHYRIHPEQSMLVPNGTNRTVRPEAGTQVRYDLIHAGPLRDYYDSAGLLEALQILGARRHDLRVAFMGESDEEHRRWLKGELSKRGLESNVDLLPWVPPDQVVGEITKARLGLICLTKNPAYKVAISTKSFSYIEAGIPILYLGPADSEQAQLIRDFELGMVAENPTDLAEKADRILSDPETLRRLGKSISTASAQLNWDALLGPLHERIARLSTGVISRGR